jgi:DNA topoisomerase IA
MNAGLITYHRTDNVNLSSQFIDKIEEYVNLINMENLILKNVFINQK